MPNLNRVVLIGHLGKDPEIHRTPKTPITKFSLAVNSKRGEREDVFWGNIVCFGNWAEGAIKFRKGQAVMVEGRLVSEEWTPANGGEKKTRTAVYADMVVALEGRPPQQEPREEQQVAAMDDPPF